MSDNCPNSMVSISREHIIQCLMEKAKNEISGTKRGLDQGYQDTEIFVYTFIAFEAFTCLRYNLSSPGQRNKAFCNGFKDVYIRDFNTLPDECKDAILELSRHSIPDMSPGGRSRPKTIHNLRDLTQVIDSIYRVRCNLFHGGKDINEIADIALISAAGKALYYILEKFLIREKYL